MPYTTDDLGNSIQFSCHYHGGGTELFVTLSGLIFSIIALWDFLSIHSTDISFINSLSIWCITTVFAILFIVFGIKSLWEFFGDEIMIVDQEEIILRHQIFGIGPARQFIGDKIDGLFLSQHQEPGLLRLFSVTQYTHPYGFINFKQGKIAFNCGKHGRLGGPKTFRFGTSLTTDEAKQIISTVHHRFPGYNHYWSQPKPAV